METNYNLSFIRNTKIVFIYILFFIVFFILNLFTPLNGDDYAYAFNYANGMRIRNIFDVFESQIVHYQTINGRLITHILVQIFSGITGKLFFDIVNSFFCTFLVYIVSNIIFSESKYIEEKRISISIITFIASLYLFSYPGQTMFWLSGAVNYLWPSIFALMIYKIYLSKKSFNYYILFLFSIISGSFHEGVSLPVVASLIVSFIWDKKYQNKKNVILLFGYTLGLLIILISPGFWARYSTGVVETPSSIIQLVITKFLNGVQLFKTMWVFLMSILLTILCLTFRKSLFSRYYELVLLWVFSFLFCFALGIVAERITFFLSIISYILSMIIIFDYFQQNNNCQIWKRIKFLSLAILFVGIFYAINTCHEYFVWNNNFIQLVKTTKGDYITLKYDTFRKKSRLYFVDYIYRVDAPWVTVKIAPYYNKKCIQRLDGKLYDSIFDSSFVKSNNTIFNNVSNDEFQLYYDSIKRMNFMELSNFSFERPYKFEAYTKSEKEFLAPRQIFIRKILKTLNINNYALNYFCVQKNGKYYCVFPYLDNNIESIKVYSNDGSLILCELQRK